MYIYIYISVVIYIYICVWGVELIKNKTKKGGKQLKRSLG